MSVETVDMANEERIRVVVFQESDRWVAQCLEYDIGAQAKTIDDLRAHLEITIAAELKESLARNGEPFAGIDPAPEHFHTMWERHDSRITRAEVDGMKPELDMALCA